MNKDELTDFLEHADKEIFKDLKDNKITMNQFKARIFKRRFKIDYTTFDDIKADLDPAWTDPKNNAEYREMGKMLFGTNFTATDALRGLLPHEVNAHCLNSLRWDVLHPKNTKI